MRPLVLPALLGAVALLALVVGPRFGALPASPADDIAPLAEPARIEAPGGATSVRTTLAMAPYHVLGGTRSDILSSLRRNGPQVDGGLFFGLTTTEIQYRFAYQEAPGACETRDARVDLSVTIRLPEWQAPRDAPYELRRDWLRFAAALRRHEEGHRDLAIEGAHRLQQALTGVRAATCDQAAALAGQRAERLQIEAGAQHRAYDERTGHGESEGAVWNG